MAGCGVAGSLGQHCGREGVTEFRCWMKFQDGFGRGSAVVGAKSISRRGLGGCTARCKPKCSDGGVLMPDRLGR